MGWDGMGWDCVKSFAINFCWCLLLICLTFAHLATAQSSGLNSVEGAAITGCNGVSCGSATDTLWADSGAQRWKMNNHGGGPLTVAQWPCLHQGCLPYADATLVETELLIGAQGTFLTSNGTIPGWSVTPTLGVNAGSTGKLLLANGGAGGATVSIQNASATSAYNFNLPATAGTSGRPLLSGGGGAAAMTYGTVTGNTAAFTSANANFTSGNSGQIVTIDANGNAQASGIAPDTSWTAGQNYIWFPSIGQPGNVGIGTPFPTNINFLIFNAPYTMSVHRMTVYVTTHSAGKNFVVGLYDVTGATLLGQATIPCGSTDNQSATAATSVAFTVQTGTPYMVGWINDDSTCAVTAMANNGWNSILNANSAKRLGTTSGSLTGDTMPTPIGTLTVGQHAMPYILLEP